MTRIYHRWEKWECYRAGFFSQSPPTGMSKKDCEAAYTTFLRDYKAFARAMKRNLMEWPYSCEHNLSNESLNRIAWLGQSAICIAQGIPSCFRGGFNLLSEEEEQTTANALALSYLNKWLSARREPPVTLAQAIGYGGEDEDE